MAQKPVLRGEVHTPPTVTILFPITSLQVIKSRFTPPNDTTQAKTQNRAPLMRLSGQPALQVRLAASSKRDGNEWAWVVNVAPTAAAVWAERTCKVAGDAA